MTGDVYGQSLYLLAKEENLEMEILQELKVLAECFAAEPDYLKLLTEKGYIQHISGCCKAYIKEYNADKGILEVKAISAIELSADQKAKLAEKLTAMAGKTVELICKVDPAVLGGIRLQYAGQQVDGTVQNRLQEMEKTLKNTVI